MDYPIADPCDGCCPGVDLAVEDEQITKLARLVACTRDGQSRPVLNDFFREVRLIGWAVELREALVAWGLFGPCDGCIQEVQEFVTQRMERLRLEGFIPVRPEMHFQFKGEVFRYVREQLCQRKEALLCVEKYDQLYDGEFQLINLNILGAISKLTPFWETSLSTERSTLDAVKKVVQESGNCRLHRLDYVRKLLLDLLRFLCLHADASKLEIRKRVVSLFVPAIEQTLIGKLCIPHNCSTWNEGHRELFRRELQKQFRVYGLATEKLCFILDLFGILLTLEHWRILATDEDLFLFAMKILDHRTSRVVYLPVPPEEYLCTQCDLLREWSRLGKERVRIFDYMGTCQLLDRSFFSLVKECLVYPVHAEMYGLCCVVMEVWRKAPPAAVRLTVSVAELQGWDACRLKECLSTLRSLEALLFPDGPLTFIQEEIRMQAVLGMKIEKVKKALLAHGCPAMRQELSRGCLGSAGDDPLSPPSTCFAEMMTAPGGGAATHPAPPPGVTVYDVYRMSRRLPMERLDYLRLVGRAMVVTHAYHNLVQEGVIGESNLLVGRLRKDVLEMFRYLAGRGVPVMLLKDAHDRQQLEKLYGKYLLRILRIASASECAPTTYGTMEDSFVVYRRAHALLAELLERHWISPDSYRKQRPVLVGTLSYRNRDARGIEGILIDLRRVEYALARGGATGPEMQQHKDTLRSVYEDLRAAIESTHREWEILESEFQRAPGCRNATCSCCFSQ